MKNLVHFSLKYDCTESLLEVLAENCSRSLRILDIERSQQVKGWSKCRLSDVWFSYNYIDKLQMNKINDFFSFRQGMCRLHILL